MTTLALIRHGPTDWNAAGRVQGASDVPLSEAARAEFARLRPPPSVAGFRAIASPLMRARETAELLGLVPTLEPALAEAHWGDYEGRTLEDLRAIPGFITNEGRGWDMTPPGGESPRMVWARLRPLLRRLAGEGRDTLAVAHRGVIRVVLARATDWNFLGKPPFAVDDRAVHLVTLDADGHPTWRPPNLALEPA